MMSKMYGALAEWWPLVSAPEEYKEEAAVFAKVLLRAQRNLERPLLLELGCGGGNNASHLKRHFRMTIVDLSPGMLAHSQELNSECEHVLGDMRSIRLDREFDAVFVHDAICYMTSPAELRRVIETAFLHCRVGGVALFVPDFTRETFEPGTEHGGHDGPDRALRYLEWVWDPDPTDCTVVADYVVVMRDAEGRLRTEHDRHVEGIFGREEWLDLLREAGFEAEALPFIHSEVERPMEMFAGVKPLTGRAPVLTTP